MSQKVQEQASILTLFVVENGRVQADGKGGLNLHSLEVEVEFEARQRGASNSSEIGKAAVELAK